MMEFAELLAEYRVPYDASREAKGWLNIRCPFCQKDPYLGYNLQSRACVCWNCGRHPLWRVVMEVTELSGRECMALCDELPRTDLPAYKHTGKLVVPGEVGPMQPAHREYLKGRGFDPDEIKRTWDVKGIGQFAEPALRWRLFVPVHLGGEVVSWTSRAIGKDKEPRYRSAPDDQSAVPIENLLYGVDLCGYSVVVVEGPADVWQIGPGAVALLGQRVSPAQMERLSRFPRRVILFDSEPDAQSRARQLARNLAVFPGVTISCCLESGKDPAEAHPDEIENLRKEFLS